MIGNAQEMGLVRAARHSGAPQCRQLGGYLPLKPWHPIGHAGRSTCPSEQPRTPRWPAILNFGERLAARGLQGPAESG